MLINRRNLLLTSSLFGAAFLGACSVNQLAQFQKDSQLVYTGLSALIPILTQNGVAIPPNMPVYLAQIKDAVAVIVSAASASAAQGAVKQLTQSVLALAPLVLKLPGIPPTVSVILQAAQVLIPLIETAVGISVAASSKFATAPSMSPDAARLVLDAYKK